MLLLGLPAVIALGWFFAWLLFAELSLWEMAILATVLAATDAALGKAVVINKAVPCRLREALNLESGLNDGLCVPVLLLFIALASVGAGVANFFAMATDFFAQELGIGIVVGLVVTAGGAWLYRQAWKLDWIEKDWRRLPVVMLALACFAIAQTLHGSGSIAAFVGGLLFGFIGKRQAHDLVMDTDGVGETLGMLTWALFGAVVIPSVVDSFNWQVVVYTLLSLTVIRMLPIVLSLAGTGERAVSRLVRPPWSRENRVCCHCAE